MRSFGVLLIILGFGSLVLRAMGRVFVVLEWADPYQPWVGIGVGVLGLIIVIATMMRGRREEEPA